MCLLNINFLLPAFLKVNHVFVMPNALYLYFSSLKKISIFLIMNSLYLSDLMAIKWSSVVFLSKFWNYCCFWYHLCLLMEYIFFIWLNSFKTTLLASHDCGHSFSLKNLRKWRILKRYMKKICFLILKNTSFCDHLKSNSWSKLVTKQIQKNSQKIWSSETFQYFFLA